MRSNRREAEFHKVGQCNADRKDATADNRSHFRRIVTLCSKYTIGSQQTKYKKQGKHKEKREREKKESVGVDNKIK